VAQKWVAASLQQQRTQNRADNVVIEFAKQGKAVCRSQPPQKLLENTMLGFSKLKRKRLQQ
jgi:hypothetical protein